MLEIDHHQLPLFIIILIDQKGYQLPSLPLSSEVNDAIVKAAIGPLSAHSDGSGRSFFPIPLLFPRNCRFISRSSEFSFSACSFITGTFLRPFACPTSSDGLAKRVVSNFSSSLSDSLTFSFQFVYLNYLQKEWKIDASLDSNPIMAQKEKPPKYGR